MLISVKHNYAFICTTKCASNSIESMLKPYSDIALMGLPSFRHTNYREYSQYIKPYVKLKAEADSIETICLIREPLSWLNSWYRFRLRDELRDPQNSNHKNSTYGVTFSEFLEAYMSPNPPDFADVGTQFEFIQDQSGEVGVDKVFLYENIDGFVDYMSRKVGKKLKIRYRNVSQLHKSKIIARIRQKFSKKLPVTQKIDEDLLSSLKNHISDDFELYDLLNNAK